MSQKLGQRTPTDTLIHRLRLMADAGGVLTKDRIRTLIEAADRMDELFDKIEQLADEHNTSIDPSMF